MNSISVPSYAAEAAITAVLDECERAVVWRPDDGGAAESARLPSASERQALEARRRALAVMARAASMSDADKRKAGAAIAEMLDGFLRFRNLDLESKQAMIAGCVADLVALPAWAIARACQRIRRGEVDGMSLEFPPTSPRLYQVAMGELAALRGEERRIEAVLKLLPRGGVPGEERARVGEKFSAFAAELRAETGRPTPMAPTPEAMALVEAANQRMFERSCAEDGVAPGLASPALVALLRQKPAPAEGEAAS